MRGPILSLVNYSSLLPCLFLVIRELRIFSAIHSRDTLVLARFRKARVSLSLVSSPYDWYLEPSIDIAMLRITFKKQYQAPTRREVLTRTLAGQAGLGLSV